MNAQQLGLLERLCNTPGVSGHEEQIRTVVENELMTIMDWVKTDSLGNLISFRQSREGGTERPPLKVMLAAHMDEIGFVVRHIDNQGFLKLEPLGWFDPTALIAQRVVIHGRADISGVIPPPSMWLAHTRDKTKAAEMRDLYVDVGMERDHVADIVSIGDPVSLGQRFCHLNDSVITARNLDNRLGVYIMVEAVRRCTSSAADIWAVATVQEELGLRGATVAAYGVGPDIGIAIDGSLAHDVPDASDEDVNCRLGGGAGIYMVDKQTVSSKSLVQSLVRTACLHKIAYQLNIGGGTDAGAMQRSRSGAHVCTIGPPVRYLHSVVQLGHTSDVECTIELLRAFLENLQPSDWTPVGG